MRIARLGPLLAAIALVLAGVLRFADLDDNPPGVWQDEASTAVDAYLIWHTGADRAGARWPVISRSFGDYPFATYRYLDAPVVGLLGISPAHERVVAATLSFLLLLALVLILRRAFGPATALGGALSAAICPTWIHLARYGSEQILLPVTLMFALVMFDLGRDANRRGWLWGGAIALGMSAYSYHAAKVLVPFWALGLLWYMWPTLRALWAGKERRHAIGPLLLVLLMIAPSIYLATTPDGNARARDAAAYNSMGGGTFALNLVKMYFVNWRPDRLFFTGANSVVLSPPGLGLWSWVDLPLILLGLAAVARSLREHPGRRLALFFVYWLIIGPLPVAVGFEPNSITRLIGWAPAPNAIAGLGFGWLIAAPRLARIRPAVLAGLVALWAASAVRVVERLMINYPRIAQHEWQHEISAALRCGRAHALAQPVRPLIVVSPSFTYADTFAKFWYLGLPKLPDGREAFTVGERRVVGEGEIFVMPSSVAKPEGEAVCTIRHGDSEMSYVYGPKKKP